MAKNRSNCPSATESRGKVNASVREHAGFENIGGSVGSSGWEDGHSTPMKGTQGPKLTNATGDSKDSQGGG